MPQASIKQGKANEIALQLKVKYSEAIPWSQHRRGIWTVRVWMSSSGNGQNELSGTVMQKALPEREWPSSEMEGKVVFNDVSYGFDLTGHTCQDAKFVCAQFINPKKERNEYYSLVFIDPGKLNERTQRYVVKFCTNITILQVHAHACTVYNTHTWTQMQTTESINLFISVFRLVVRGNLRPNQNKPRCGSFWSLHLSNDHIIQ